MSARFEIPEDAENALWQADQALAFVETLASQAGDEAIESRGDEVAAFIGLVRGLIRSAREQARFVAD